MEWDLEFRQWTKERCEQIEDVRRIFGFNGSENMDTGKVFPSEKC